MNNRAYDRLRDLTRSKRGGYTIVELLIVVALLGILIAAVVVPVKRWMEMIAARSSLNRVVAEIYRARSLAVSSGVGASLTAEAGNDGCIEAVRIGILDAHESVRVPIHSSGVCLRHSGDSVLVFNSRGMIKPPTRSYHARYGPHADSLLISMAGRVRRSY